MASGPMFFGDHKALNNLYLALDEEYDSLAERRIGLTGEFSCDNLVDVLKESAGILESMPESGMAEMYSFAAQLEINYCIELKAAMMLASEGTKNLVAHISDNSEIRQYKLQQRLK